MPIANLSAPPFIIFTPKRWSGSAGIYALHSLGNNLLAIGCDVYFYFYDLVDHSPTNHQNEETYFYEDHLENRTAWKRASGRLPLVDDSIVIYPEVIPDNPLNAKKVVRYVMNYPEKNMHPMRAGKGDFILCFFEEYFPNRCQYELPIIFFPEIIKDYKNGIPFSQRSSDATYIGKGVKLPGAHFLPGTLAIDRDNPKTKNELYNALSKTRYFFSWDPISTLNIEALYCGALPVLLRLKPYFDELPTIRALGPLPHGILVSNRNSEIDLRLNTGDFEQGRMAFLNNLEQLKHREISATQEFLNRCLTFFRDISNKRDQMSEKSLMSIHLSKTGKVSDKWESYLTYYDNLLSHLRSREISLLEIGVQNGGSLESWSEYFPSARHLVGCDINEKCRDLSFLDQRINIVIGNSSDPPTRDKIRNICAEFDLVIDDGSHRSVDIINNFLTYFPTLKPNGIYIIEDTHAVYWNQWGGGILNEFSAYNFFKKLVDVLNYEFWQSELPMQVFLRTFFSLEQVPQFLIDGWLEAIEFRNSLIVIRKASCPGIKKLGKQLICGSKAEVEDRILRNRKTLASP